MDSTIQLIFTVVGAALVLVAAYGAFTKNRRLFLSGFCYFSILPIIGEYMAYRTAKSHEHLFVMVLYLIQFLLTLPDKNIYASDNKPALAAVTKIALAIVVINIMGVLYIFHFTRAVPMQFGYYHVTFTLIMLYVLSKRFFGTISWAK